METVISRGIVNSFFRKLDESLEGDVAIVGAGPSGLVAAARLARAGKRVSVFESKLAPGGGMWGGAMMFSSIIVQREALDLLEEFSIDYEEYDGTRLLPIRSGHVGACFSRVEGRRRIFNCMCAEDVMLDPSGSRVCGLVMNWGPVVRAGMHVDPLVFRARAVMDSTGHPAEIVSIAARKNGIRLATPTGCIMGERSLSAMEGERLTVENTKEIFPGLFVSGMAANGVSGSFRMGPIFGGMLLSGGKAARLIMEALS